MIENAQAPLASKTQLRNNYYLASISFLIAATGLIFTRILFGLGLFSNLPDAWFDFLGSVLIQIVFIFGGGLFVLLIQQKLYNQNRLGENYKPLKQRLSEMGFRLPRLYLIPLSIVLGILFFIMNIGVSYINTLILFLLGYNFPPASPEAMGGIGLFLLALFNSAVLPGFCEEFLNRGLVLRGLRSSMNEKTAILISALLFGLLHANIRQTLYTFVGGIILATLTIKTRSILPAMIIHFMNNAISVYSSHASYNGWPGANWETFLQNHFLLSAMIWVICSVALAGIVYWIVINEDEYYAQKAEKGEFLEPKTEIITSYETPFGVNLIKRTPLYQPGLQDKIMMYSAIFLLALTTAFSLYLGMF